MVFLHIHHGNQPASLYTMGGNMFFSEAQLNPPQASKRQHAALPFFHFVSKVADGFPMALEITGQSFRKPRRAKAPMRVEKWNFGPELGT